jgi:hypothetical protein
MSLRIPFIKIREQDNRCPAVSNKYHPCYVPLRGFEEINVKSYFNGIFLLLKTNYNAKLDLKFGCRNSFNLYVVSINL